VYIALTRYSIALRGRSDLLLSMCELLHCSVQTVNAMHESLRSRSRYFTDSQTPIIYTSAETDYSRHAV